MGWRGALRSLAAAARAQERESLRRARAAHRERERLNREHARLVAHHERATAQAYAEAQRQHELAVARAEVEEREAVLEQLQSVHRQAVRIVHWSDVRDAPAPTAVPVDRRRSVIIARAALDAYQPGFLERHFGLFSTRPALEDELRVALIAEQAGEAQALAAHAAAMEQWHGWAAHAARVLSGDLEAYAETVSGTGCLDELEETLGRGRISVAYERDVPTVVLQVEEDSVVPTESKTLSARGVVTMKKLAAGARFEIYQDYVCGAALRAARELVAVLPVRGVLVHVEAPLLDGGTGHFVMTTILSVFCPRDALIAIDWNHADASDVTERLLHSMKLARGKAFAPVARVAVPRS